MSRLVTTETDMLVARYRHRLPADYPMERIRRRIAERASAWDRVPGLAFKAFVVEDRATGSAANAYSSLYLWRDAAAAGDFLAGPGFASVVESFGRPRIETWLVLDLRSGTGSDARGLSGDERLVDAQADLSLLRETERARGRDIAAEPGVLATLAGLDPAGWRLTRFTLRAAAAERVPGAEVVHLAVPDLAALRGA